MKTTDLTVKQFAAEQQQFRQDQFPKSAWQKSVSIPVITVCMEPGSGGRLIASTLAERLNFELFDKNILTGIANTAAVESRSLDAIEKERPSGVQDFISSLLDRDYVYTGDYVNLLKQQFEIIAKIGRGVIVGRGGNFILPPSTRFSIRVIAPLETRIRNIAFKYRVTLAEAKKRIKHREQRRRVFIREAFHHDIANPLHYDMVINTERMDLNTTLEAIIGAIIGAQGNGTFKKETNFILGGAN
jgi:cytidylate kinase